jgi:hypothetical protein
LEPVRGVEDAPPGWTFRWDETSFGVYLMEGRGPGGNISRRGAGYEPTLHEAVQDAWELYRRAHPSE